MSKNDIRLLRKAIRLKFKRSKTFDIYPTVGNKDEYTVQITFNMDPKQLFYSRTGVENIKRQYEEELKRILNKLGITYWTLEEVSTRYIIYKKDIQVLSGFLMII